jgi:hypothetical protein
MTDDFGWLEPIDKLIEELKEETNIIVKVLKDIFDKDKKDTRQTGTRTSQSPIGCPSLLLAWRSERGGSGSG